MKNYINAPSNIFDEWEFGSPSETDTIRDIQISAARMVVDAMVEDADDYSPSLVLDAKKGHVLAVRLININPDCVDGFYNFETVLTDIDYGMTDKADYEDLRDMLMRKAAEIDANIKKLWPEPVGAVMSVSF